MPHSVNKIDSYNIQIVYIESIYAKLAIATASINEEGLQLLLSLPGVVSGALVVDAGLESVGPDSLVVVGSGFLVVVTGFAVLVGFGFGVVVGFFVVVAGFEVVVGIGFGVVFGFF